MTDQPSDSSLADHEQRFRQSFCASLAQALQDNESRVVNDEDALRETYIQLCHDEPQGWTKQGCEQLAKALLRSSTPYALSERLISGVMQVLENSSQAREQVAMEASSSTEEQGIATLAWTMFVGLPLRCFQVTDLREVAALLGSYRGTTFDFTADVDGTLNEELNGTCDLTTVPKVHDETIANHLDGDANTKQIEVIKQVDDTEVWAEESDPSDYVYESGYDYQRELVELSCFLDPSVLSRVPENTSWSDVAEAVASLLQTCRYSSHLKGLSDKDWKEVWQDWVQLILMLLVLPKNSTSFLLQVTSVPWQKLGLSLLHVVRDAALDRPNVLLAEYVQLLQCLLQVQAAWEKDHSSEQPIVPSALIGLGALSELCSDCTITSSLSALDLLKTSIVEACDDLTLLLERSMNSSDILKEDRTSFQWAYVSLFQLLGTDAGGNGSLNSTQCQALLQSGLFRQWLLHWMVEERVTVSGLAVQRNLLTLCSASPSLLGKYVWRFPGLAWKLCQPLSNYEGTSDSRTLSDVLLWNLLAMELEHSSQPQIKWKASPSISSKDPPTMQDCQKTSWSAFQSLCQKVEAGLSRWKYSSGTLIDIDEPALSDFGIFVEQLASLPLVLTAFMSKMTPPADGKSCISIIQAALQPLKLQLSKFPMAEKKAVVDIGNNETDAIAEKDDLEGNQRITAKGKEVLNELRRNVKTLSTFLLNDAAKVNSDMSSKTD